MQKREGILRKRLEDKTIRKWLLAFLIVFTIQILCWLLATKAVSHATQVQADETYQNALRVLAFSCDNDVNSVSSMLDSMVLDENIRKRCNEVTTVRNIPYQNELVRRRLASYNVQHAFIDDIYIYLSDSDKIISSNTVADSALFYDVYGDVSMSYEDWLEALEENYYKNRLLWENSSGGKNLYILHSWEGRAGSSGVTIAVKYKASYLQSLMDDFRGSRFAVLVISDEEGEVIAESGSLNDGTLRRKVSVTSDMTGWIYTAYISEEGSRLYAGSALIVLALCFTAVIIAFVAVFLSFFKTNINPFRELMQYVSSQSPEEIVNGSGYVYIKDKFDEIVRKQKENEQQFENRMNLLKLSYLGEILTGKLTVDEGNRQLLEKMRLEYLYEPCAVVLISGGEKLSGDSENEMELLKPYGIGMSGKELLYGCSFVYQNTLVCLLKREKTAEEIRKYLIEVLDSMKQSERVEIIAVSSLSGETEGISKLYGQAKFVMQSARQLSVEGILFFDDIRERVKENARENKNDGLVQQVREYIQEHYAESDLTIELLCGELGKSVSYLSQVYKEKTGQNILYDLNLLRVEKAKELLREKDSSVDEVGRRCGFTNSNSFIRVFKKYEKVTPGKYREIYLAGVM